MEEARDTKKKRSLAVASSTAGGGVGLTDDLVFEILSRVPVKSICCFKCVSPSWRNLISHPDNRKKLPQALAGFFRFDDLDPCSFISLADAEPPRRTGKGWLPTPSPCDSLPANSTGGAVVDCCNGLLLLNNSRDGSDPRCASSYVVCNPATEKWTTVPGSTNHADNLCTASILCFDPAVSEHFHVVELLERQGDVDDEIYGEEVGLFEGFNIYPSETGAWVFHPHSHWSPVHHRRTYFNGGLLHFVTAFFNGTVAALDMEGQTRRVIHVPQGRDVGLIGHSQGRLLYANIEVRDRSKVSIYVLGENGMWTLEHCIDTSGLIADASDYFLAAIHPHCDSIFLLDSLQRRLVSYNMDSQRGHVVRRVEKSYPWSFVPYVPLYLETPAPENSN